MDWNSLKSIAASASCDISSPTSVLPKGRTIEEKIIVSLTCRTSAADRIAENLEAMPLEDVGRFLA